MDSARVFPCHRRHHHAGRNRHGARHAGVQRALHYRHPQLAGIRPEQHVRLPRPLQLHPAGLGVRQHDGGVPSGQQLRHCHFWWALDADALGGRHCVHTGDDGSFSCQLILSVAALHVQHARCSRRSNQPSATLPRFDARDGGTGGNRDQEAPCGIRGALRSTCQRSDGCCRHHHGEAREADNDQLRANHRHLRGVEHAPVRRACARPGQSCVRRAA